MACFGEKPHNLEAFLVATDPRKDLLLGNITCITSSSVVYRRFNIADSFVVGVVRPMKL